MRGALDRRFATALGLSLDPGAFRVGQAAWLGGLSFSAPTLELRTKAYAERLGALDEMIARLGARVALLMSLADVKDRCLSALIAPAAACKVIEFGEIGTVDGRAFAYARYEYAPNDFEFPRYTRVVAFEHVGSTGLRAVVSPDANPADTFDKPQNPARPGPRPVAFPLRRIRNRAGQLRASVPLGRQPLAAGGRDFMAGGPAATRAAGIQRHQGHFP